MAVYNDDRPMSYDEAYPDGDDGTVVGSLTKRPTKVGIPEPGTRDPRLPAVVQIAPKQLAHAIVPEPDEGECRSVRRVSLLRASTVKIEQVRFAFEDRIPLGAVTLIAGQGGKGKTTLGLQWLAQITRGTLPGELYGTPTDVVVTSEEDHRGAVLNPRLIAAGADLERVHYIDVTELDTEEVLRLPTDLGALAEEMRRYRARVLLLDPLIAYLPAAMIGDKDQHVRQALAPLANMAEDADAAVIGIMHLNKMQAADLMVRVNGSGGFVNAARSVLAVANDPQDETHRIVAHGKSNWGVIAPALRFRIESRHVAADDGSTVTTSGVVVLGEADGISASDLLRVPVSEEDSSERDDAAEFLRELLSGGPMDAGEIKRMARAQGISDRTLARARDRAGVKFQRQGFGTATRSVWALAALMPPSGHSCHTSSYGTTGTTGTTDDPNAAQSESGDEQS